MSDTDHDPWHRDFYEKGINQKSSSHDCSSRLQRVSIPGPGRKESPGWVGVEGELRVRSPEGLDRFPRARHWKEMSYTLRESSRELQRAFKINSATYRSKMRAPSPEPTQRTQRSLSIRCGAEEDLPQQ